MFKPKLPALEGETKRSNAVVLKVPKADTPREAPQPVAATVRRIKINMMP